MYLLVKGGNAGDVMTQLINNLLADVGISVFTFCQSCLLRIESLHLNNGFDFVHTCFAFRWMVNNWGDALANATLATEVYLQKITTVQGVRFECIIHRDRNLYRNVQSFERHPSRGRRPIQ